MSSLTPALTRSSRPTRAPLPLLPFLFSSAIGILCSCQPVSGAQPCAATAVAFVELAGLSFGPLIEFRHIHKNLTVGSELYVGAIHGTRRWSFEVNALTVVPAAVARTLEFVLTGLPVRSAAQVRASRVNHENPIRSAIHPYAVLLLELGIHTKPEFGWIADLEAGSWLKQSSRQEEAEKSDEPGSQESRDAGPYEPAT